jgi:SAM-dependent methyltransferase
MQVKTNPNSHLTAIQRNKLSFPGRTLKEANLLKGKILDYGAGFGQDVSFLQQEDFDILGYDPFYQPILPEEKFDTILCFYVLNVIQKEEQSRVIWKISQLLKANGHAYFAVRRDLKREGFRHHAIYKKETYQCQVRLPFKSYLEAKHCEIYAYERFSELKPKRFKTILSEGYEFLGETACTVAFNNIENPNLVSLFPKREVQNFHQLNAHEQAALLWVQSELKADLIEALSEGDYRRYLQLS